MLFVKCTLLVLVAWFATAVLAANRRAISCTSTASSVYTLAIPKSAACAVVFDLLNQPLLIASVVGSTGAFTATGLARTPGQVDFYSDPSCEQGLLGSVLCIAPTPTPTRTSTSTPTLTPTPTRPSTSTPTLTPTPTRPSTPTLTLTQSPSKQPGSSRAPSNVRAMYVWEYSACLFNTVTGNYQTACGASASDYLTFQDQILNNVLDPFGQFPPYNRLYVEMDIDTINSNPSVVQAFLSKAHSKGIAIEFLGGDATWVTTAALAAIPMGICDNLVTFNGLTDDSTQWIDGVNFDIEPHTLGAAWHQDTAGGTDRYNQAYQATLIQIFRHCMQVTRSTSMTVTWDVGNDYYHFVTDLWIPLVQNPYVDYVTIMNYFSNETAFLYGGYEDALNDIGGISNILASLNNSVPAVFAAESMPPAYAPAWESFYALGSNAMEETEAAAVSIFGNQPGFAGTATHWYASYFALLPNGAADLPSCSASGSQVTITVLVNNYVCYILYSTDSQGGSYKEITTGPINGASTISLNTSSNGPFAVEFYDAMVDNQCSLSSVASTVLTATC